MNAKPAMEKTVAQIQERIRKPGFILLAALIIAISAIALLIANTIFPTFREEAGVRLRHMELDKQLKELEKQPLPERVDLAVIRQLAQRVPMSASMPEFMSSLSDLESRSGADISSLTVEREGQQDTDLLTEYLQLQKENRSASARKKDAEADPEEGLQMITPIRLTMTVRGSYEQVLSMMSGLQSLERIVVIHAWSLQRDSETAAGGESEGEPVQLALTLTIYQAAGFRGKFPEMPQPEVLPPEYKRQDPMIGEQRFLDMLRQSATMH
jgi:Tfp pilus assembly protein PilO